MPDPDRELRYFQICVPQARHFLGDIRSRLAEFPEIVVVLRTRRPDLLELCYTAGHARPHAWLAALRAAGYRIQHGPLRSEPESAAVGDDAA